MVADQTILPIHPLSNPHTPAHLWPPSMLWCQLINQPQHHPQQQMEGMVPPTWLDLWWSWYWLGRIHQPQTPGQHHPQHRYLKLSLHHILWQPRNHWRLAKRAQPQLPFKQHLQMPFSLPGLIPMHTPHLLCSQCRQSCRQHLLWIPSPLHLLFLESLSLPKSLPLSVTSMTCPSPLAHSPQNCMWVPCIINFDAMCHIAPPGPFPSFPKHPLTLNPPQNPENPVPTQPPTHSSPWPTCPAGECLLRWLHAMVRVPPPFSEVDATHVFAMLAKSRDKATRKIYRSGLLAYHIFCNAKGMPKEDCAPVNPYTVSIFLASMASLYAHSTIINYLYGLKAWHVMHGLEWSINRMEVNAILKAVKSMSPPSSKWPPRWTVHNRNHHHPQNAAWSQFPH